MDTLDNIPVCLKKSENYITDVSFTDDYNLNVSCAPEDMFPPYIPYICPYPKNEDEPQQKQQSNNLEGVFHIINEPIAIFITLDLMDSVKTKEDNGQSIYERVEIILPNYSECCMWGYENVRDCGDTSRCK
jgi:hypothetical protein